MKNLVLVTLVAIVITGCGSNTRAKAEITKPTETIIEEDILYEDTLEEDVIYEEITWEKVTTYWD